jgi:transcriptional regulator
MKIPRIIFKEADQNGIKVYENTLDIISKIHETIPEAALHRRVNRTINIFIGRNGEVSID